MLSEEEKKNLQVIIQQNKKKVEELLSPYKNLKYVEIYYKFSKELDSLIIDIKGQDIDVILDFTSSLFINKGLNLSLYENKEIENKLSKLYHKLKNLYFFNQMIFLYNKIKDIYNKIKERCNSIEFKEEEDIILTSVYEYEKNINANYKSLGVNIKSTNSEKFKYLCSIIEELNMKEDIYRSFYIIKSDFEEGYTLKVKFNDDFLIMNNSDNLKKEKELLKKYGIENRDWDDSNIKRKPLSELTEEEKKQKEELKKKEEEEKKIKLEKLINSLQKQEIFIKNNFLRTKKNTKNFKHIFTRLKEIMLSNEEIKNNILKILPYGSVTQCTNNESSDLEMTIITKNFETCKADYIRDLYQKIIDYIDNNVSEEFGAYLEGIRETKRTILLLLEYKETKTRIEINCNNFFSVMNSNLIRTYLTYDARALILINTIKDWSKNKEINSNGKHFLSSYCYTLMTIFFLQRMKEPILPIISSYDDLINMKISEKEFFLERLLLNPSKYMKNWHTENKSDTVVTLILKWMIFYLYIFDNMEYCIDIGNPKLCFRVNEAKYLTDSVREKDNVKSAYCIIDMFDYTYNPGSYMEFNSPEHNTFIEEMENAVKMILEGKIDFFLINEK